MISEDRYVQGMERLVTAISALSLARDVQGVREIVRTAAREMTGADGATFILREGEHCHYVDEDAIAPLWKGKRFPMTACISGWSMMNKSPVALADIYSDARISAAAYRPTFVKSLAMTPIRASDPIGAIGNYWATHHTTEPYELKLLQALADSTSVALENIRVHQELESRVRERTEQLEAINAELEAFSYSVSHDLQAPVRAIRGFNALLAENYGSALQEEGRYWLQQVHKAADRMDALIKDLLELSHVSRLAMKREYVDLSAMARELLQELQDRAPDRQLHVIVAEGISAVCDGRLIRIVLENLLSNAWKFTGQQLRPVIEFGVNVDAAEVYFVRDNGVGFQMEHADRLFAPFQRLHSQSEFPGTGVGLATVRRVIERHGGTVWADSEIGRGSTFHFTVNTIGRAGSVL